jgi:arylsulfatase A-like enzyme
VYRSWWQGTATSNPASNPESPTGISLPKILADAGYATCLLTDEPSLATDALAADFDQNIVLPPCTANQAAQSLEETHAAQFFAAAVDVLGQLESPYFCWMHWRGMLGPWDAPMSFRERLADEEDPSPPEFIDVPSLALPADDDPDHLLGIMQAYGGQVMLLDECLGVFWEQFLADPNAEETLLMLCSPRGYPLGEHRVVGLVEDANEKITGPPYSELVHVPWLLRFGDGRGRLDRSSSLVQPVDLLPTVLDVLSINTPSNGDGVNLLAGDDHATDAVRGYASTATASHVGLRTSDWHYMEPRDSSLAADQHDDGHNDDQNAELYVKPDDRWEVNNVVNLCREEAAKLRQTLRQS